MQLEGEEAEEEGKPAPRLHKYVNIYVAPSMTDKMNTVYGLLNSIKGCKCYRSLASHCCYFSCSCGNFLCINILVLMFVCE